MLATLVDVMGDDLRVVNAARVSFNKESDWEEGYKHSDGRFTGELSEKDQKLIKYLATHNHWTPFSHVIITMRELVPVFTARQRFKHTVGFTYNERSGRYVGRDVSFFTPAEWRKQATDKKQGSSDELVEDQDKWHQWYKGLLNTAETIYDEMVKDGIAIEQARMVLPQSMYTEYYVTGSLAAWARAYKLRIDPHAQKEIQDLATQWNEIIGNINELHYSWRALIGEET